LETENKEEINEKSEKEKEKGGRRSRNLEIGVQRLDVAVEPPSLLLLLLSLCHLLRRETDISLSPQTIMVTKKPLPFR